MVDPYRDVCSVAYLFPHYLCHRDVAVVVEVFSCSGHVAEMDEEYPIGQGVYGVSEVFAHQSVARLAERDAEIR